ncbi:MAG: hypothetical protein KZQ92_00410 [Candidatus Thiodiazotropha sp. (ex Lucinoma borealis)]|nr:hypothetical protein [Candidatus Thiodiazotropha sp. (ex Lucinoma borealis)]
MNIETTEDTNTILSALIAATEPLDASADELHSVCLSLQQSMEQYPETIEGNSALIDVMSRVIVDICTARQALIKGTQQFKHGWKSVEH